VDGTVIHPRIYPFLGVSLTVAGLSGRQVDTVSDDARTLLNPGVRASLCLED
jgi:hypothetical protein